MPKVNNAVYKKKMLAALEKSLGVVTVASMNANISRKWHYNMMLKDEEYKKEVMELEAVALDFAETSLFKQIREGQPAATIFFLKTKGKHRGYIERTETELVAPPEIRILDSGEGSKGPDLLDG